MMLRRVAHADLSGSSGLLLATPEPSPGHDTQKGWLICLHAQGGTCVILGDDYKLMGETAKIAKQKLGCQVFRRPPYFRKAGHVQAEFNKEPLAKRCGYTVQFLQEIEMMTHADYFVGARPCMHTCT
jgi:hypothetical protein